jgi:ubiquitin carboxyl-terminal hydrolase L5
VTKVAISSSDPIRKAHNAFGRTDAFLNDGKYVSKHRQSEDVFHFVAYIPKDGVVYELDGLKSGPVAVGMVQGDDDWLTPAREAIQERMTGDAIQFNLMAVIEDKREGLKKKLLIDPTNEDLVHELQMEEEKRKQWSLENQRRQHNYVPLCVSILRELARAKKLPDLIDEAKKRKRQKVADTSGITGKTMTPS